MRRFALAVFALLLACVGSLAFAQAAIPELRTRITDTTGTLDAAAIARIEAPLVALESTKGAQVAVLMVSTTQPETIEAYAARAFEQFRLGRAGIDDGVLLVVAKDDRATRIEVGYGLEGTVPDVTAHRVIQEYLLPRFREGDFAGGVAEASATLAKLIDGEALPEAAQATHWDEADDGFHIDIDGKTILGVFMAFMLSMMMRGMADAAVSSLSQRRQAQWRRARWLRGAIVGSGMGGFFLAISTGLDGPDWLVALAAIVGFLFGIWKIEFSSSGSSGGDSGSSYGDSSSSSSSSSSDYSGGGGRSGGGGASGSW